METNRDLTFAIVAALLVAFVAITPVACTMHRQQLVSNAISQHPNLDPISVKCAIEGDTEHTTICLLRAAQTQQK